MHSQSCCSELLIYQQLIWCLHWVAGAVLGALAGVLLAGSLWFFCCRCRLFASDANKKRPSRSKLWTVWPFRRHHKGQAAAELSQQQPDVSKLRSLSSTSSNVNLLGHAAGSDAPPDIGSRMGIFNVAGV